MGKGNQGIVPLEFGCTIKFIQESTVKDNSSAVIWLAHVFVVTKVTIQISDWVFFYRKAMGK